MTVACPTYRESHQQKGAEYHSEFQRNPRRRLLWRIEQQALDLILNGCPNAESATHLDFACGTGRVLKYVEPRVASSTGVDISPSMLAVAAQTSPHSTLIEADLTRNDPLGDRQFDIITAFRFFPNAERELRVAAIEVLARHLTPEGRLVFNNHRSTHSLRKRMVRWATAGRRGVSGMSPDDVLPLIRSAGLNVERTYHAGVVPEAEQLLLRPRVLVSAAERVCSKLPLSAWAEDVIYVCRHNARGGA